MGSKAQSRSMDIAHSLAHAKHIIADVTVLLRRGLSRREISAAAASGVLTRVRAGWYAETAPWTELTDAERQLAAVVALHAARDRRSATALPVLSHRSAAALLGWPAWSGWYDHRIPAGGYDAVPGARYSCRAVHTTVRPTADGTCGAARVRHRADLAPGDIAIVHGFRCTSEIRTIVDLARSEPLEVALACADHALRTRVRAGRGSGRPDDVDEEAWMRWRAELLARADALPYRRGTRAVRAVALLADPRADSPLESVSRLRFIQHGIDVDPQVPVHVGGSTYWMDLALLGLRRFGECDGRVKYTDERLLRGQSLTDVLLAEKTRYDRICGATGWSGLRWGAREAATAQSFAAFLRECGVPVRSRASRRYGDDIGAFLDALPR